MSIDRRRFFRNTAHLFALSALTRPVGAFAATPAKAASPYAGRRKEALERRIAAARAELDRELPRHRTNGDEKLHDPRWSCFSKGLPHETDGQPAKAAAEHLWRAMNSGDTASLETVPLGGYIKLSNPQAAYAFDLIGPDAAQPEIPPPPAFSSAENAGELVELYWKSLARDVPFDRYASDPLIARACRDLNALSTFKGLRDNGAITPATVFRGGFPGGRGGPYVSQFLWRDLPWTPIRVPQKIRIAAAGKDYLTRWDDWLNIENGNVYPVNDYETKPRYIVTGRDLAEYVHRDFTYQAFLGAALMLFRMSAPLDGGIPYQYSISQSGFVTFGASDILSLVASVSNVALKATWYQKWVLHRRVRPEEFAARVHQQVTGGASYPIHADVLNSAAASAIKESSGGYLLPQSYPEGAPLHPAYPAGHAVIAGACVTVLKACFAESFVIPNPQVPSEDGSQLVRYNGPELNIGSELDKLAENIAMARNFAGVHWRSDGIEGIRLGEDVAIAILRETRAMNREIFSGFALTKFDGTRITV